MTEPVFDRHAADYDATVQRAIGASGETVEFFAKLKVRLMSEALGVSRPRSILDFGCGIGNTTRELAAAFPTAEVTGFDVSGESIEVARRLTDSSRVHYVSAIDRVPVGGGAFDVAFTACVFHHIEPAERVRWAKELRRVLALGGQLFLFEHNPWNPFTVRVVRSIPFDEGVRLLPGAESARLLREAGFEPTRPRYYFFFPSVLRSLRRLEPWLGRVPVGAQYLVNGRAVADNSAAGTPREP